MADAPLPCTPGGPGVDILGVCFVADPVIEGILYALVPIYGFFFAALTGPKWRARIRGWLYGATWSTAYAGLLDWLLAGLDRVFGPPCPGARFERCFAFALIYAVMLLWIQGGYAETRGWVDGVIGLAVFAFVATGTFYLFRWIRKRHETARLTAEHRARRIWLHMREQGAYLALGTLIWIGAFAAAGAVAQAQAHAGAFAGRSSQAHSQAHLAGAVAGALVAVAGALAVAGAARRRSDGAVAVAIAVAAVFLLLPLLNALFDWPSWWASRWLMTRLRDDATRPGLARRIGAVLGHLALDLGLALICLFGLAAALAAFAHAIDVPGLWRATAARARHRSRAMGLNMTVMMVSTLVPTVIHLFFAVFALAVVRPPWAARTAHWLQEDQEGGETGTQMLVALYLTACAGFALVVLWGAGRLAIMGLDAWVGGSGIWVAMFDTADWVVESLGLTPPVQ